MKGSGLEFRPMTLGDIPDVLQVERASFRTPWSRQAFYNELAYNQFAYYTVVILDGRVIGYGGMWLILEEAHITNIAIHPDYRGQGVGEKTLNYLMESARRSKALHMTLEVRVSNATAQRLYRKKGFEPTGIRPRYYSDNQEDAVIMWVKLGGGSDETKPESISSRN
ncbi:MAG: ribosomal protein S18-alanine N-acetyltransferase [Firmicutes bacterium]|uniref:Ribosomal-protein-alanine N-acetyltransferase n=1 Tax=Melghirimyces thermohalophilus TaxID=1236220 RepID=A0A1G6R7S5_9BACL|nr:ribosomal protein S18-alanine N-acetyltransferase [Melghirimyces thermohalophilus]MDA8352070.1 ribosomal protein S18-alanine N-acetyltransferase [Bacillota bacterium]TMZ36901.1 ribosomal-protein-alanine N-acetyltransferase [Klebsiella pneumoniae]SDD00087.1 ribosomal-protein-alanine N-acetyltransferase [Melghirimyces thermohalophilus]